MYTYKAKTVRVIDGDTLDLEVDLGFHLSKVIRVRLKDVDAPEVRGSEKRYGLKVKKYVEGLVFSETGEDPQVIVSTEKTGSFGRWLATIYIPNQESNLASMIKKYMELNKIPSIND